MLNNLPTPAVLVLVTLTSTQTGSHLLSAWEEPVGFWHLVSHLPLRANLPEDRSDPSDNN